MAEIENAELFKKKRRKKRRRFSYDNLYSFTYTAKHVKRLEEYDRHPLIIPLYVGPRSTLGLNLHWINPFYRFQLVQYIMGVSAQMSNKRKVVRITYGLLKRDQFLNSGLKGVRRYLHSHMKNSVAIPKDQITMKILRDSRYKPNIVDGDKESVGFKNRVRRTIKKARRKIIRW